MVVSSLWREKMRYILIPDPFNKSAQVEFDMYEIIGCQKSVWLLRDDVHRGSDSDRSRSNARGHVCWPMMYRFEDAFGIFKWLLKFQSNSNVLQDWLDCAFDRFPCSATETEDDEVQHISKRRRLD